MNEDGDDNSLHGSNFSSSNAPLNSSPQNGVAGEAPGVALAGTPDYFGAALDDIVLMDERPKSHKKTIILISVITAILVVVCLVLLLNARKTLTVEKAKDLFSTEDALAAFDFDNEIALIYDEKQDDDVLFSEEYYKEMINGYEAYAKIANALDGYADIEGEDNLGRDKKIGKVSGNMKKNLPIYSELIEKYKVVYSAKAEGIEKLDSLNDEKTKNAAKEYLTAVNKYEDFYNNKFLAYNCDYSPDNMALYSQVCRNLADEMDGYKELARITGAKTKEIFIGKTNIGGAMERLIGDDLMDAIAYLGEMERR